MVMQKIEDIKKLLLKIDHKEVSVPAACMYKTLDDIANRLSESDKAKVDTLLLSVYANYLDMKDEEEAPGEIYDALSDKLDDLFLTIRKREGR